MGLSFLFAFKQIFNMFVFEMSDPKVKPGPQQTSKIENFEIIVYV